MTQKELILMTFSLILDTLDKVGKFIPTDSKTYEELQTTISKATEAKLEFFRYAGAAEYLHEMIESVQNKNTEMRNAIKSMLGRAEQKANEISANT